LIPTVRNRTRPVAFGFDTGAGFGAGFDIGAGAGFGFGAGFVTAGFWLTKLIGTGATLFLLVGGVLIATILRIIFCDA